MKKLAILCTTLCVFATSVNAVEANKPMPISETNKKPAIEKPQFPKEHKQKFKKNREEAFEQKLGLTEVQKLKARQLREQSHANLAPVMQQIKDKKQEAEMIRRSRMAVQMQEEKLAVIDKELATLEKQAKEIRKKNMKDFESILTREQRKTLKNMKKEGRKRFEANHKKPCLPNCPHHK